MMRPLPLSEIAALLGVAQPHSTAPCPPITGVASLEVAQRGELSFFANQKYLPSLRATSASVVLVPLDFTATVEGTILLRVADPSLAFADVVAQLIPPRATFAAGIHPTAIVSPEAEIDPSASVQPYAVVEAGACVGARVIIGAHAYVGHQVQIGDDSILHPRVTLHEGTVLGRRVFIQSGAVIGSDGFGFAPRDGRHVKIPQVGFVQLDDDVEIGAGTTVDRARFGRTWIQAGTKIDNLVQIAHNVVLGEHCLIASQTGISGSARVGRYVTLAGQVGVVGHVEVGDHVLVMAKSGISKNTPAHTTLLGMIGGPIAEERELMAHYRRLPKTVARLKALEAEVAVMRQAAAKGASVE